MREEILILGITLIIVFSFGCIDSNYPAGYSIYHYSGISYVRVYDDLNMEECELISRFAEYDSHVELNFFDYSRSSGTGRFTFDLINQTTNEKEESGEISLHINDCEFAPGYPEFAGEGGKNVFITNVTISLQIYTELETAGMESSDEVEADRLSESAFQEDISLNSQYIDTFRRITSEIFQKEPNRDHLSRSYSILCVD